MGAIVKRVAKNGDATYQAKIRRKNCPTQSKTFQNKKDAERWMRAAEAALDRGEMPTPANPKPNGLNTLADILRRYRDTVCNDHKGGWIEVLKINIWLRQSFSKTPLADLSPSMMAAWRDDRLKKVKPASCAREMNLLFAAINKARTEWGCTIPDCKVARPKSPPHRERVLEDDEEVVLLTSARASVNPHLAPAIEFALATAMRAGEIIGLRWVDVDRQRRVCRIREAKNGHPRDVPLSSKALAALESIERDGERVFSRLTSDTLKHLFARLTKRCELDNLRFHDLRHTAITRYARLGMNPIQLAVISGHKDIRMLARYTHLKAEELVGAMG
ncbi:site-specific integrase [Burkholderia gladioli]|uniref:tyrosine-type recombinase/integrase n=1 Tax=Burkholderia gladioli TaxID=28095 RepID=UPI0030177ADA